MSLKQSQGRTFTTAVQNQSHGESQTSHRHLFTTKAKPETQQIPFTSLQNLQASKSLGQETELKSQEL